jgi:hypothetical protein
MTLRCWKCGSANEEVQRLAVEAGKFLEFDDIYSPFPAFTFGDEKLRPLGVSSEALSL